jgi:hypothetical protein
LRRAVEAHRFPEHRPFIHGVHPMPKRGSLSSLRARVRGNHTLSIHDLLVVNTSVCLARLCTANNLHWLKVSSERRQRSNPSEQVPRLALREVHRNRFSPPRGPEFVIAAPLPASR